MNIATEWIVTFVVLSLAFSITGILVFINDNTTDKSKQWRLTLRANDNVVFAWHLACWMIAGMLANYYWGAFNRAAGKSFVVDITTALLPLLVAPIVFYPAWNLWSASSKKDRIMFVVLAFQNGFFWQAFFEKAAQSVK